MENAVASPDYNYKVVRQFTVMSVVWGIVGMAVGVFIAAQLAWPALNFNIPWLSFGRLRPLHTNAVIFAFGGSALMGTSYYVVQRTCSAVLAFPKLAAFSFWGWQVVICVRPNGHSRCSRKLQVAQAAIRVPEKRFCRRLILKIRYLPVCLMASAMPFWRWRRMRVRWLACHHRVSWRH